MIESLRALAADERGMITTDWVVLTAATLVALIVLTRALFNQGVSAMIDNVDHSDNGISMGTGPQP